MALEDVDASPDDVVVTVGAQQALDLIARLFLDPGDVVLAEGPTYVGALGVFAAAQAEVVHVAMDADGLQPDALRAGHRAARSARAGAGQVPLHDPDLPEPGRRHPHRATPRRDHRSAEKHGLLVVEDDPYGLLGFEGAPRPGAAGAAVRNGSSTSARSPRRSPPGCGSAGSSRRTPSARSWSWSTRRSSSARRLHPDAPSRST